MGMRWVFMPFSRMKDPPMKPSWFDALMKLCNVIICDYS